MNNQKETIRKFVNYINNPDQLGGFWLPNIQRPFVWSEEQIERLYDSILRADWKNILETRDCNSVSNKNQSLIALYIRNINSYLTEH